jgi:hypothetical protein
MLEKLAMHDVQDVSDLLILADKCAWAAEGRAWHSQPAPDARKAGKPKLDADALRSGKNKNNNKKKASGNNTQLVRAPTVVAATAVAVVGGGRGP